ncbi:hypothetical protein B0H10DRAFT_405621 [Mycena sp. CBHHK59/15]|nr:hypothetical protein B0H10DRAFT_405621 [Mycena sp. CBHHK59/15]
MATSSQLTYWAASGTLAAGLVSFLVRSSCPLTHLTLQDISIRNDELISILSLTPQLTHLTLNRTGSRPDNALMHGSGKPNLLQHLMFLSVALIDTPNADPRRCGICCRAVHRDLRTVRFCLSVHVQHALPAIDEDDVPTSYICASGSGLLLTNTTISATEHAHTSGRFCLQIHASSIEYRDNVHKDRHARDRGYSRTPFS